MPSSAATICVTPIDTAPDPFSVAPVMTCAVPSSVIFTVAWPGIGFVIHTPDASPTPCHGSRPACTSFQGAIRSSSSYASARIPASSSTWPLRVRAPSPIRRSVRNVRRSTPMAFAIESVCRSRAW